MRKLITLILIFNINNIFAWSLPVVDLANGWQNATIIAKQAKQLENEIETLKLFTKNSKKLSDLQWRDLQGLIAEMDNISKQGYALSFAMKNAGEKFDKTFPDVKHDNKQQQTTRDTLKNNILLLQKSADNFDKQQQIIEQLKLQSKTAEGQMQALQISSEIAAENVNQIQELKRIISSQSNASAVFMSHQLTNEAQEDKAMQDFLNSMPKEHYKPKVTFGRIKF